MAHTCTAKYPLSTYSSHSPKSLLPATLYIWSYIWYYSPWIQLLCILSNSGSTFTRMYFPLFCALIHIIIAFISDLFTFDDYLSSIKQAKKMLSIKLKAWVKQVQAVLCLHKLK